MGIIKTSTQLHLAPSTTTQLNLPPPSFLHVHPPPLRSFQPLASFLLHLQRYNNQNIARNLAIFPKFRSKKSHGTHGILEEQIRNPDLDFQNSDHKIHFRANLGRKIKVVCFAWKLANKVSRGSLFLFHHQFSEFLTLNPILGKFGPEKSELSVLPEN